MSSQLQNVFIFGVVVPAVITVTVFVIFLICWFKCNIREKILERFPFCKKKAQPSSNNSAQSGNHRNHSKSAQYVQDNLDCSSSTGHDSRHSNVDSPSTQAIPMQESRQLSNMGFEIGEDYVHSSYSSSSAHGYASNVDQSPAGAGSSQCHLSPDSYVFGANHGPISSSSPVEERRRHSRSGDSHVTVHMEDETTFSEVSDNRRNLQSHATVHSSPTQSTSHSNRPSVLFPAESLSNSNELNRKCYQSSNLRPEVSTDITPGVHKPSSSNQQGAKSKRVEYIQQVFQFPHSSRHHRALSKMSGKPGLDNSSSSYSSSSNEGDYYDREGDYSHFYPTMQQCLKDRKQEVFDTRNSAVNTSNKRASGKVSHVSSKAKNSSSVSYIQGEAVRTGYHGNYPEDRSEAVTSLPRRQDLEGGKNGLSSTLHPYRYNMGQGKPEIDLHFLPQDSCI